MQKAPAGKLPPLLHSVSNLSRVTYGLAHLSKAAKKLLVSILASFASVCAFGGYFLDSSLMDCVAVDNLRSALSPRKHPWSVLLCQQHREVAARRFMTSCVLCLALPTVSGVDDLSIAFVLPYAAMILGGGPGTDLWPLTNSRAEPAVPFAGLFRLVDVPLSNCIHSGISNIYVSSPHCGALCLVSHATTASYLWSVKMCIMMHLTSASSCCYADSPSGLLFICVTLLNACHTQLVLPAGTDPV